MKQRLLAALSLACVRRCVCRGRLRATCASQSGRRRDPRREPRATPRPCWADIDGDGKKDLLVGQFNEGKIRVFKNLGDGKLAAGDWLKADGKVAEVPGVW